MSQENPSKAVKNVALQEIKFFVKYRKYKKQQVGSDGNDREAKNKTPLQKDLFHSIVCQLALQTADLTHYHGLGDTSFYPQQTGSHH
jgi:hypothetical protein